MKTRLLTIVVPLLILFNSCETIKPLTGNSNKPPQTPDYAILANWAAHPEKKDNADRVPEPDLKNNQANANVDVFFVHPTTYTGNKGQDQWNGPVNDAKLNEKTDNGTILFQASVFNGSGKIYAPRYRQAHLHSYFTKDTISAMTAFKVAYKDVERAFKYYLENNNNGRPFIIASHSQGTTHSKLLIKNLIDGKELQKQFIAAYIVGIPVEKDYFETIKPCDSPTEINCFCTWRTWLKGHYPKTHQKDNTIAVTNPITWTSDASYADRKLNTGTVLRKFNKGFKKQIVDAQVHNGILWINKPKFFGNFLINWKNYHIADYNLFYANIRENVEARVNTYLAKTASDQPK